MNKKNTTKKSVKPTYVVDITWCKDIQDIAYAFAITKQKAGIPLSDNDVNAIRTEAVVPFMNALEFAEYDVQNIICACECKTEKKPGMFKRFWNWLTGRK